MIRDFERIYGRKPHEGHEIGAILVRSREDVGLAERSREGVGISKLLNVKANRLYRVSRGNGS